MIYGQPLDDLYFGWLCSLAGVPENDGFVHLLRELHSIPFETFVANDENRAVDGMDLRSEFFIIYNVELGRRSIEFDEMDCSIFEMLIALSSRLSYKTSMTVGEWLIILTENLGIRSGVVPPRVAARRINRRSYAANGKGGMFPLKHPRQDQREVEIWYQMSAYLIENGDF